MAYPVQTFPNLPALLNYINTKLVTNGTQDIDAVALNNVVNSLADFIVKYTVNGGLANVVSASAVPVMVSKPINIISGSQVGISWDNNVQNEYYFVNATGSNIPLTAGFFYVDSYGVSQTSIPLRQTLHIAKTTGGVWVKVNTEVIGSGSSIPPQTGNRGKFLSTNGSSVIWSSAHVSITSADFSNATDCPMPGFEDYTYSIFWSDLGNYIYEDAGQWQHLPGSGFRILIPSFDSSSSNFHFEVNLKPKP